MTLRSVVGEIKQRKSNLVAKAAFITFIKTGARKVKEMQTVL